MRYFFIVVVIFFSSNLYAQNYDDLSFGDRFYCKKNNNPYYHKYTERSPQWDVPKDKIFQDTYNKCRYGGKRISFEEFCSFEKTQEFALCRDIKTTEGGDIIIANEKFDNNSKNRYSRGGR